MVRHQESPFNRNVTFQWTARIDIFAPISTGVRSLKAVVFLVLFISEESAKVFLLAMFVDEFSADVDYRMQPPHGTINVCA